MGFKYKVICKGCGKEFMTEQHDILFLSKYCFSCRNKHKITDFKKHTLKIYDKEIRWLVDKKYDKTDRNYYSELETKIVNYLMSRKISYEYEPWIEVENKWTIPDFRIGDIIIEICGYLREDDFLDKYAKKIKLYLEKTDYHIVIIVPMKQTAKFKILDTLGKTDRIDVVRVNTEKILCLEKDNITNVDYTHFLFDYDGKCNQIHSHTSYSVGLKVWGYKLRGMVVDFKEMKSIVKEVIGLIDHKVVVGYGDLDGMVKIKYGKSYVGVKYTSINGKKHEFKLPVEEVFIMEGRATLENLMEKLGQFILDKMPYNVFGIELSMKEGIDNGCRVQVWRDEIDREFKKLDEIINQHLKNKYER